MMTVPPPDNKVKYDCDDKKRICFTKEDIEDLDTEDMRFGGTPLHWVKHRRTLEKLIAYGFRLDVTNANGETALHTMVKRLRLKCMIGLLCYGAGVEQSDRAGDTPLHCAVKLADVTTSQALIIFDSDIDVKNKYKESPRHCAATGKHADHHLVLYVLTAIGAKRCDSNMKGCESGCAHNGNFEGKPYYKWPTYENESFYKEVLLEPIVREALLRKKEGTDQKSKPVRIICFDGGGIRGLITIQLLIEMEKQLKYPIANYFEWMAGTSTGSIIAMLLATGRSLREGRKVYFRLKDKIFVGSRPYSAKNFEKLLEDELGSELKMCDIRQTFDKKVIVNATLIDRNPAQLHVFRSYESPEEILGLPQAPPGFKIYPGCKDQIAWKACRASGAAPTYFSASDAFLDGGLIANNPTLDALTEFRLYNNSLKAVGRSEEAQELDLIVSFGTGRHPIIQEEPIDVVRMWTFNPKEIHKNTLYIKQMGNLLVNEATATEGHIVDRAQSWCSWIKTPYFRINPQLSEVLGLDETSDVEICNALWESKAYMYAMRHNVNIIVQLMSSPQETQPKIDIKSDKNSINSQTNFGSQSETGFSVSLPFSEIKIQSEIPTI